MRIQELFFAVLLVSLALAPARAQTPAPSLEAAEQAFADTLLNHDRPAFMATFTADAECSLPTKKHGPEDIAKAWLPFLIDPSTTMLLTSTKVVVDRAGEVGSTTGTFAIRGRTSAGVRTIPAGTYSIVWRLVDGRWRIGALSGSGNAGGNR
jgi:ketosteroid isomerase-like protein